jgi:hypothetical protein
LCEESGFGLQQLDCRRRGRIGPDGLGVSIKGSVAKCFAKSCTNPVTSSFADADPNGDSSENRKSDQDSHSNQDRDTDQDRHSDQNRDPEAVNVAIVVANAKRVANIDTLAVTRAVANADSYPSRNTNADRERGTFEYSFAVAILHAGAFTDGSAVTESDRDNDPLPGQQSSAALDHTE